jgi:hypothetical protein
VFDIEIHKVNAAGKSKAEARAAFEKAKKSPVSSDL